MRKAMKRLGKTDEGLWPTASAARRRYGVAMQIVPSLTAQHALFLDFDGTLADIAAQPDAVQVLPEVAPTLRSLHQRLDGALAIVSGRTAAAIDGLLAPLRLPLASEHGAWYRLGANSGASAAVSEPDLAPVLAALRPLIAAHPALVLETKPSSLALHYRQAPQLEAWCHSTLARLLPLAPGTELMRGRCVLELKPAWASKGRAIGDFMRRAPFAGRVPIFVGDDVTDETGFATVQELGGLGVKVGPGPTLAQARLDGPAQVRAWLRQTVEEIV